MRRARVPLFVAISCAVWWACTDGGDPTAAGRSAALGIVPSFQVDPALFPADPVDRILLRAHDAETQAPVGSTDQPVNPAATQWSLSLGIDLGGQDSRSVIVDAELFSGSTVVWSGRLGPFTVPTVAPALSLDVYRGPLDNLDVLSVAVSGAASQLVVGASLPLTASLTLVAGSDATPVIFWASTDPAVATVTPSGPTATLTAVAAGTTDIIATAGAREFVFSLEVLPPGSASKTWVGGAAVSATSWSEAANWSPTGVPTASDDVLIPLTANNPVLAVAAQVNDLTVLGEATLDLGAQAMTVSGDLRVDGVVLNGQVTVGGSGALLQGTFADLMIVADRAASGGLTTTGDLSTAASFDVGPNTISVGGDLATLPGGRLVMTSGGASMTVAGQATFGGASEAGFLTAGQLNVLGDFAATGTDPQSFAAGGTHSVSLNGSAPQTIDIVDTGPTSGRFGTLHIDNSAGVDLAGAAYVANDAFLSGALTVAGGQNFDVAGVLTLEAGSTLNVDGTVTAGSCVNLGATIQGTGTHPCGAPASGGTRTWIGGASPDASDWGNPNNWSPAGVPGANDTVSVSGSSYSPALHADAAVAGLFATGANAVGLSGFTLTVSGDLDALGGGIYNGVVDVTGAGSVLQGYFGTLRVSSDRSLSAQVYVSNDLEVLGALDVGLQTVSVIGNLAVSGTGTLVMADPAAYVYVYGNALFNGGDHTNALTAGTLAVVGDLHATDASPTSFVSSGTHSLLLSGPTTTLTFEIPGGNQQRMGDVTVASYARSELQTDAYATGDVMVDGHLVVPAGRTLTIDGTLTLSAAAVLEAEGTVIVSTCTVNGGVVIGNGAPDCGTPLTVDRVWRGGAPGAVTMWEEPTNWAPVGVPQPGESVFIAYDEYMPVLTDNASVGDLYVHSTAYLDLGGYPLTVDGDVNVHGYVSNGEIQVTGSGTRLEGYIDNLRLDAPRALSGYLLMDGNADLQAKLTVGAQGIYTTGNLTTSGAGEISMDDANGFVEVGGTTSFGGLRTDLTAGSVYVLGDLLIDSPWSGGAGVYIGGEVDQIVSLSDPGTGTDQQYFADLFVLNTSGMVTLEGPVYVTGEFYSSSITITGTGFLQVNGRFNATGTTFSGLPVRIDTSLTPSSHVLSGLTFTGYDPQVDTQLFIRMPGDVTPLTISSPTFNTAPDPGKGYYIDALNNAVGADLTITLTSPTPMGVTQPLYKIGAATFLNWP